MQARMGDDGWLKALRGPSKWRQAQGERVVAAWRASGKSLSGFAGEHGLKIERIRYWLERVPSSGGTVLVRISLIVITQIAPS
jgi:hypothetical protein